MKIELTEKSRSKFRNSQNLMKVKTGHTQIYETQQR